MAKKFTIFQNLDRAIDGNWGSDNPRNNTYDLSNSPSDEIIYKTDNKQDFETKKLELQQNRYLSQRWQKANVDLSVKAFSGLNNVKLMYRDVDLMDSFPEIGAALTIVAEEASTLNDKGQLINVFSKSDRVKKILEDLFNNRLDIVVTAPMIIRAMCKYGNQFMLLNIDNKLGVTGWRQLPVFNVERLENGIQNAYGATGLMYNTSTASDGSVDMSTRFIWVDENNSQVPFRNWQIGHFRLLNDSLYLPYGSSYLNNARRHFRMLSLMEDMMLIYRLDRSIERRVYKIFVGAIDDKDVPAYVEEIANNFKRTPIIDPMTGQVDLRKNILSIDQDVFIPVRNENAPTPIDTLQAAQNLTAMDDIKFIQNKVLTALRIPKTFLNFEDSVGDGKNLALMDVRFSRTINRIQQAFLMEMTKIASIHLYLLGFEDELTNFSLTMNNPSTQAEQLEIDNLQKKITAVRDAVADPGNGIPIMSLSRALKEIMKWSDKEIQENFEEIRLEKAIAAEIEKTSQIIKKTGIFDIVDKTYGEPGAEYQEDDGGMGDGENGGIPSGGGAGGGGSFGSDLDSIGGVGDEDMEGDISGEEGEAPVSDMNASDDTSADNGSNPPTQNESRLNRRKRPLLTESKVKNVEKKKVNDIFFETYMNRLKKKEEEAISNKDNFIERSQIYDKSLRLNEEFDNMVNSIDEFLKD